jgi:hypothetical protein
LARAGQLTTAGINLVKKEEAGISVEALKERLKEAGIPLEAPTKRLGSHAPKGVKGKGEDEIVLPADFEAEWSDGEAKMVMPPETFVTDVRSLPPNSENTYLPVTKELLVQAGYKKIDPAEVWALGRSEEGPRNHVLLLRDTVPGRRPVFALLFQEWVEAGQGDLQGLYPCLTACVVPQAYSDKGFEEALLDTLLQVPGVDVEDHLVMRVERTNHAFFRCLEKIGARHGRTLHKVGAVASSGQKVDYRAIKEYDRLLECCLSRGAPTIYPAPREPGKRPPLSKKQARRAMLKAQKEAAAAAAAGKKKTQKSSKQPARGKKMASAKK